MFDDDDDDLLRVRRSSKHQLDVRIVSSGNQRTIMPMAHLAGIDAKNPYQKTGTGFWRVCMVCILVPNFSGINFW